jgi:hypothetical protein
MARRHIHPAREPAWTRLKTAIGAFLMEFGEFESLGLRSALLALFPDEVLVETLQELMDTEHRFKLLQKVAERRGTPADVMKDLKRVLAKARKIRDVRNEVAHNWAVDDVPPGLHALGIVRPTWKRPARQSEPGQQKNLWVITADEIEDYARQAAQLNAEFAVVSGRLIVSSTRR